MYGGRPCHYEKYSNNAAASHAHESELWLAFYILQFTSDKAPHFDNLRLGIGCRSPPRFAPAYKPEQNERNNSMNGRKNFHTNLKNQPNEPVGERVVSERGRKELPPGTKGGENLKPDRHYEHKQYAFDSYCKKVLKCEACNGYRQISRHQKRFTSLEELSEAEMAQLAVYDRYPWEYTTFPVGGTVILIEDDGLAEALLGLSQEDREIFMMHWFLRMTDAQIARYINMPRRTVNTRRHKAYRLLTELMGGEADD